MSNQSNHIYFPAPIQAIQPIQKCHPCPLPQVHLVKAFTLASRCCWVDHHSDVALRIQQLTSHLRWPNGTKVMISWRHDISWYMIILLRYEDESKLYFFFVIVIRIINSTQVERTFSTWVIPFVLGQAFSEPEYQGIEHKAIMPGKERERERSNPLLFFQMDLLPPNFYAWICQVPGHKGEKWCLHSLIALGVSSCCNWRLQRLHLLKSKDFHQATYIKASSRCHMLQGQSQAFQHASAPEVGTVDP